MYKMGYNSYRSTQSYNRRVRSMIFYYMALYFKRSMAMLAGSSISANYLVPDFSDKSYT